MTAGEAPVLIIGWRNHLVDAARRLGLSPVVVYGPGDKDWAMPEFAPDVRAVFAERPSDAESILTALARAGLSDLPYQGVCPGGESSVVVCALIAQVLGAPGLPLDTAVRARDKFLQKERMRGMGHLTAASRVIDDMEDVHFGTEWPPAMGFPVVLKPIDGVGTSYTRVARDESELVECVGDLALRSGRHTFVLEEFVPGDEWEIDGVVRDGVVEFFSVGMYEKPVWHIQKGTAIRILVLDPDNEAWAYALMESYLADCLPALGIQDGVFHLEVFHQVETGRLVFSECAVRPGGGLIPETVAAKFGVNLTEEHLRAWCGLPAGCQKGKPRPGYFGSVFFPSVGGTLVECPSTEDLRLQPGVVDAIVQTPVGFGMGPSAANVNMRMGLAVQHAPTLEELRAEQTRVLTWFAERVVTSEQAPSGLPPRFLRAAEGKVS
ncbi:hypothetical protein AB0469_38070 [Streptomyces sp. NPDC093801]|uniref:ATP-grasp domain-containing protein n=1 Tax=Streptomyces sp. NPDC093801 TaxID=3155203 RepID=UPI00344E704F